MRSQSRQLSTHALLRGETAPAQHCAHRCRTLGKGNRPELVPRGHLADPWQADTQKSTISMGRTRAQSRAPGAHCTLQLRLKAKAKAGAGSCRRAAAQSALSGSSLHPKGVDFDLNSSLLQISAITNASRLCVTRSSSCPLQLKIRGWLQSTLKTSWGR